MACAVRVGSWQFFGKPPGGRVGDDGRPGPWNQPRSSPSAPLLFRPRSWPCRGGGHRAIIVRPPFRARRISCPSETVVGSHPTSPLRCGRLQMAPRGIHVSGSARAFELRGFDMPRAGKRRPGSRGHGREGDPAEGFLQRGDQADTALLTSASCRGVESPTSWPPSPSCGNDVWWEIVVVATRPAKTRGMPMTEAIHGQVQAFSGRASEPDGRGSAGAWASGRCHAVGEIRRGQVHSGRWFGPPKPAGLIPAAVMASSSRLCVCEWSASAGRSGGNMLGVAVLWRFVVWAMCRRRRVKRRLASRRRGGSPVTWGSGCVPSPSWLVHACDMPVRRLRVQSTGASPCARGQVWRRRHAAA